MNCLAPQPIPRPLVIPHLRRIVEVDRVTRVDVGAEHLFVDVVKAQTRFIGNVHKAVLDQRVGQTGDQLVPLWVIDRMIFQHQEVFGGGSAVGVGQRADR